MMAANSFKVKKPYDHIFDQVIEKGHCEVYGFSRAAPAMRVAKHTKTLKCYPCIPRGRFLFVCQKVITKDRKRSMGAYSYYKVV